MQIRFFKSDVQAGIPSLIEEFTEGSLDLNEYLIPNKSATLFVRVTDDSMIGDRIFPGDLLIVDRSLSPIHGEIIIAILNGEMTVKRFLKKKGEILLHSENDKYRDIEITEYDDFSIWGLLQT